MSGKRRIPLARAQVVAAEVATLLAPACERIEIAGSIRREKPEVGDVEIVCAPSVYRTSQPDMFGGEVAMGIDSALDGLCDGLLGSGRLTHRQNKDGRRAGWGKHNKLGLYYPADGGDAVPLDIFAVYPSEGEQWGVAMLIRTGPADFNPVMVARQDQGGALPFGWCIQVSDWTMRNTVGQVVPTPEEADVFEALGLPFIPSEQRSAARLRWEIKKMLARRVA
jgi:DNA polymerase/3'-5' exonuclease PolX